MTSAMENENANANANAVLVVLPAVMLAPPRRMPCYFQEARRRGVHLLQVLEEDENNDAVKVLVPPNNNDIKAEFA
jgi:ribosomal protein S2